MGKKKARQQTISAKDDITLSSPVEATVPTKELRRAPACVLAQTPSFVAVVRHFFNPSLCGEWIKYAESIGLSYMHQRATRYMAFRKCYRVSREDSVVAERIFLLLQSSLLYPLLPKGAVGCNPNIRIYKYTKGMAFGKHIDESATVAGLGTSRYTILIYLSECSGGATRFEGDVSFDPEPGALLIHAHGDLCLEHEADPVLDGVKYVLRTDLVYPTPRTKK